MESIIALSIVLTFGAFITFALMIYKAISRMPRSCRETELEEDLRKARKRLDEREREIKGHKIWGNQAIKQIESATEETENLKKIIKDERKEKQ